MLIAICDDEAVLCESLKNELYDYFNSHNIDAVIETYPDGSSLVNSGISFDLVILDYKMPGMNGLQTAKLLRAKSSLCTIIFLTVYPEIVYDTFEYGTFRFLIKPLDKAKLYEALDAFRRKLSLYYPISLSVGGEVYKINTKEIIYIEADGKNSVIRLKDNSLHCTKTLSEVYSALPKSCFYKTHRSYVVNFAYIEKFNKQLIRFTNGEYARISKNRFADFQDAINTYLSNITI